MSENPDSLPKPELDPKDFAVTVDTSPTAGGAQLFYLSPKKLLDELGVNEVQFDFSRATRAQGRYGNRYLLFHSKRPLCLTVDETTSKGKTTLFRQLEESALRGAIELGLASGSLVFERRLSQNGYEYIGLKALVLPQYRDYLTTQHRSSE
jgi:hypothetical protein